MRNWLQTALCVLAIARCWRLRGAAILAVLAICSLPPVFRDALIGVDILFVPIGFPDHDVADSGSDGVFSPPALEGFTHLRRTSRQPKIRVFEYRGQDTGAQRTGTSTDIVTAGHIVRTHSGTRRPGERRPASIAAPGNLFLVSHPLRKDRS